MFKQVDTLEPDRQLEFLDVLHVTDQTAKGGFITKIFYKENRPELVPFKWFFTPTLKCLQINRIWRDSPIEEVE